MARKIITGASPGFPAVVQFLANSIYAEILRMRNLACANVDRVVALLRSKGARVPDMKGWSCDQKIAFVAVMTPGGIASLVAGALVEGLAENAVAIVERGYDQGVDAVARVSHDLGLKMPRIGGTAAQLAEQAKKLGF